jgi:speckle-type POZ protein
MMTTQCRTEDAGTAVVVVPQPKLH